MRGADGGMGGGRGWQRKWWVGGKIASEVMLRDTPKARDDCGQIPNANVDWFTLILSIAR